jgi:sugar O-acyltransferase (sialic acid O-acetyltransferase NeuD family)
MKKKVAFLGSGEMARHAAFYMVEDNQFEIAGYYDDFTPVGEIVNGYTVLGTLDEVETGYKSGIFDELMNTIGYTRFEYRKELFERFDKKVPFATFIHSSCIVASNAKVGKGVLVFPKSILYFDAVVEDNVFIQINSYVTDSIVRRHTLLSGTVSIAGRSDVGECCFLGIGTTVSNDIKICNNVITGASTTVVKNITEPGLYVGSPARKIK